MFRALATWSALVVIGGSSAALGQDAPPLEAPAAETQANQAPKPASQPSPMPRAPAAPPSPVQSRPSLPSTGPSQIRPLLVVPGVTSPSQSAAIRPESGSIRTARPAPLTGPQDGYPRRAASALPGGGSPIGPSLSRQVPSQPGATAGPPRPIVLEAIEDEPEGALPNSTQSRATPNRAPQRPASLGRTADDSGSTNPPSWRPPGVLGRLLGLPPQSAPRSSPRGDEPQGRVEPQGTPREGTQPELSSDAVAKRRIERQIRDSLGDKLRSVEVRVTGRNVLIVVKPSRFWQKRGIRRTLDTLPVLDGYRARIDVAD